MLSLGSIMFSHHNLHSFAFAQLFSGVISVPALASEASDAFSMIVTTPSAPVAVMVTARKGTRNYVPDDADASDDPKNSAEAKENAVRSEDTAKERLDQCLARNNE
jgi:hypothetical protein